MIFTIQERLRDAIRAAVRTAYGVPAPTVVFQYPPKLELGDLALPLALGLAKTLSQKPRDIAQRLAAELASLPDLRKVEVAGPGYLNLFLKRGAITKSLHRHLARPEKPVPRGRVIVEHTSINPNKAAHIGHLRNAVLGDTFVRLLRHRGHDVGVQNYIDDTGVQVADVVVGFQQLEKKSLDEVAKIGGKFDYYCWDLYAKVGEFYKADPTRNQLQKDTLHAIEAGNNDTARMAEYVAARIVETHILTMERLGIQYDLLAHESDILRLHFWNRAFALLKESGAIRLETEGKMVGCWVLGMSDSSENAPESDEIAAQHEADKIIVRSNGTVTYTGKDIAYQLWKLGKMDREFRYRRYHRPYPDGHALWQTTSAENDADAPSFGHAEVVYNVIDKGQEYPQKVVKAAVAAIGYLREADASHHLSYDKVVLSTATARALGYEVSEGASSVKVSGRKGLGVKADDLVDSLFDKARTEIATRDPERDSAARDVAARAIAVGALRFFLLKFGKTKVITFDMEDALAFVGETGPYVQNAVVRARSIFKKLAEAGHDVPALLTNAEGLDFDVALEGEEGDEIWGLLLLMARTDEVIAQAVDGEEVSLPTRHAFSVAQAYHSYFQKAKYSVLHAESEERRALRVFVVDTFVRQMTSLMHLLGIPIPERM
jgi:arginyl-tRNA synthetase